MPPLGIHRVIAVLVVVVAVMVRVAVVKLREVVARRQPGFL